MSKRRQLEALEEERHELIAENRRLRYESRALLCLLNGHSPSEYGYEPPVALIPENPAHWAAPR